MTNFMISCKVTVIIISIFGRLGASQPDHLCGMVNPRTALINDRLYFSSASYAFDDGEDFKTNSSLFALDLARGATLSSPLPLSSLEISELPADELWNAADVLPSGWRGTYFYDHEMMYPYGAIKIPDSNTNSIWGYNSSGRLWALHGISGGKIAFTDNSDGIAASDPESGLSFYTGGNHIGYNGSENGIVRFDSSNSDEDPNWAFATTTAGMQGPSIMDGTLAYVRKGKAGVLVAFSGYNTSSHGTQFGDGFPWDLRSMTDIFVYDIFSNTWYLVQADGDIPEMRSDPCTVVSAAPDDSSFQITMYAGFNLRDGKRKNDVYVLSLPTFTWIQIDTQDDPDTRQDVNRGRNAHKCHVRNDRQMIVIGGDATGNGSLRCDSNFPPLKALDLSTYTWLNKTESNVEDYKVPSEVFQIIGGDASGGSDKSQPAKGWSSDDLVSIFAETVARKLPGDNSGTPPSAQPPSSSSSSPSADQSRRGLSSGTIAGVVVGCIVTISAAAVVAWICVHRRKRRPWQEADSSIQQPWLHNGKQVLIEVNGAVEPRELPSEKHIHTAELPLNYYRRPVEMYAGPGSPKF